MAASSSSSGSGMDTTLDDPCSSSASDRDIILCEGREKKVASLLDRLKCPTPADIARSRKIQPPRGKRTCRGALGSDPKGVSPNQRVKEFPLTVSHGQLLLFSVSRTAQPQAKYPESHVESVKHRNAIQ